MSAKKTLLIIDKNEQNRKCFCSLLGEEYHIAEAETVCVGKAFLEENRYSVSVILFNPYTSPADADSLLTLMRGRTFLFGIPVLILVEDTVFVEVDRWVKLGAVDFIEKPYHKEIIKNRISNAILLKDSMTFYGIEKMLKKLPSLIFLKDKEARYIFSTHYWHHLEHGDDPNWTIRGKTDPEIRKDTENAIEAQKADLEIIASGRGTSYTIEINADGIQDFLQVIKEPVFDEDGNVNGIIGLINNVTEHELLKKELEIKAVTDELTGLYNRVSFFDYLEKLRDEDLYPVSIISADCDNLKSINDTYGHTFGDEYIRKSVCLFKKVLPQNSRLFRVGGDEFVFILPSTSQEDARIFVEKMKKEAALFRVKDHAVSVSYGVSTMNGKEDSSEECVAHSDEKMYQEKRKKHTTENN